MADNAGAFAEPRAGGEDGPAPEQVRRDERGEGPPGSPETPVGVGEATIRITASFGVATLHPDEEFDALYARADAALYAAKDKGRDRVEIAT